ncbi:hypothetical protein PUN28_019884 [Cardiocondyla obscurior]|uniref:Uncharacterized protein n=1 Tax=Cardiocondyla obscurior TaxID=286306 RepID=A0AAW2E9Z9_9HYME
MNYHDRILLAALCLRVQLKATFHPCRKTFAPRDAVLKLIYFPARVGFDRFLPDRGEIRFNSRLLNELRNRRRYLLLFRVPFMTSRRRSRERSAYQRCIRKNYNLIPVYLAIRRASSPRYQLSLCVVRIWMSRSYLYRDNPSPCKAPEGYLRERKSAFVAASRFTSAYGFPKIYRAVRHSTSGITIPPNDSLAQLCNCSSQDKYARVGFFFFFFFYLHNKFVTQRKKKKRKENGKNYFHEKDRSEIDFFFFFLSFFLSFFFHDNEIARYRYTRDIYFSKTTMKRRDTDIRGEEESLEVKIKRYLVLYLCHVNDSFSLLGRHKISKTSRGVLHIFQRISRSIHLFNFRITHFLL